MVGVGPQQQWQPAMRESASQRASGVMQCYKVEMGGDQVAFKYSSEQEALIFPRQGRRQAAAAAADKDMVVACMRCVSVARAVMWSGEDRCRSVMLHAPCAPDENSPVLPACS